MRQHQPRAQAGMALHQVFAHHYSEYYWLAFLLTGDRERSVRAFTNALDLWDETNPVFREFMVSWPRRLIIAAALATTDAELRESMLRTEGLQDRDFAKPDGLPSNIRVGARTSGSELERAILAIDMFPRCALLLTVFEGLPIEDVASLLNADEALVRTAQARGSIELTHQLALGRGWDPRAGYSSNPGLGASAAQSHQHLAG